MKELFDMISRRSSKMATITYSTSFSMGIRVFSRKFHDPIYGIYGFVRFADEIVDSFHGYDKAKLLQRFKDDTFLAIEEGISLNPILNNFQSVVNTYKIEHQHIRQFLRSMELDLDKTAYTREGYEEYILGSAEVVGLMCLRVFCHTDDAKYNELKSSAMKLGSAFQKVNFLRDLKADVKGLGRTYFPGIDITRFNDDIKKEIEDEIEKEFEEALSGIRRLPGGARFGVYIAYIYFHSLLKRIRRTPASKLLETRVRVPDTEKYWLLTISLLKNQLNMI